MKICKKTVFLSAVFVLTLSAKTENPIFAQENSAQKKLEIPAQPKMPSTSMPTISSPSLGKGFYIPGNAEFYSGRRNALSSTKNTTSSKNEDSGSKNLETEKNSTATAFSDKNAQLSELKNYLTAGDLSNLSSLGILGGLSGLSSENSGLSILGSSLNSSKNLTLDAQNSIYLQQILSELEGLKNMTLKTGNFGVSAQNASIFAQNEALKTPQKNQSILRFLVNGQNLKPACKTVFFSEPQIDGTFLLTGDCKYQLNGKNLSETFYILFKADGATNGSNKFTATTALSQTEKNTSSYLYKISQLGELYAYKTGNLVTLKAEKDGTNLDLLLSM
ncbi:hypothetical protein [Treponema berlinense]|uniref:hypothetical protein n=1 Tax=Treponema berlinense TaxID=225004 RepID=UPI003FD80537